MASTIELTPVEMALCKPILECDELKRLRQVITLFMTGDQSYAMFRLQARDLLISITIKAVLDRPFNEVEEIYINKWVVDLNPMFRHYYEQLNKLLGREAITIK